jgi:type VI secretion system secreted protein Hcp
MAFDAFLKVTDAPGESTDKDHKGWIEVLSYGFGVFQESGGSHSGGGSMSSGRSDFRDFSIVKRIDKSTNKLIGHAATCYHIPEVKLEVHRNINKQKAKYYEVTLKEAMITDISAEGQQGGNLPTERVKFSYGEIVVNYVQWTEKGQSKGNVEFIYNLKENVAK